MAALSAPNGEIAMTRIRWAVGSALVGAVVVQAPAFAASPTIAQIAPPDTIAVLAVDDFAHAREIFEASFLGDLWRDQEMQDWFDEFLDKGGIADEFAESAPGAMLEDALDRAGMEREEIPMPTGAVGAAFWWGEDPDIEDIGLRWVMVGDFGDGGDAMEGFVESMIEVVGDEETLAVEEDEYEGAAVWLIEMVEDDTDDEGALDDEDWDDWEYEPEPVIDHAHVAWIDGTLVIAGDRGALERAINRINGEEMDSLADGSSIMDVKRQNEGAQAYAAGFIAPMLEAWLPDEAMMGFSMDPMLEALGVLDLRSVSMGVRFDGPGGAIQQTYGVAVPEKKGLIALFDNELDSFRPPSLVGADANTVYQFGFDWSGLMPLLNRVVESIPDEDMKMQAQLSLGFFAGGMAPLFDGMRPDAVVVKTLQRPFSPESGKIYAAFGVSDEEAISNGITGMQGMLGFEPRDFMGNQIWESQIGAALGLGFGRLFVGPGEMVEDAMRQAGQDGAAGLADEDLFIRSTSMLRGGGMLYTYQNSRENYEHTLWTMNNLEAITRANLEAVGYDEETIQMIIDEQREGNPFAELEMPSAELIYRYVGETVVGEAHSTDDGFRSRSLFFSADQD